MSDNEISEILDKLFSGNEIRRVLLVSPPDGSSEMFRFETGRRRRYTNFPPYGLGIIAKNLESSGIKVHIENLNHTILKAVHEVSSKNAFDFNSIWREAIKERIQYFRPDLIGVTCMFTMTHPSLKRVCEFISSFDIPIAIGGVHVTNDADRVLDDIGSVDLVFTGEGDIAIRKLVGVVNGELPTTELGQLIINNDQKRYRFPKKCQPSEEEISILPSYELMDTSNYSRYGVIGNFHGFRSKETRFSTVLSNRGCRAQCTFCSVRNFNGVGVRQRRVDSVLDELEILQNEYGIGHIMWLDDDLLKDKKRAIDLFNGMIRRNIDLTWDATNGVIAASCTPDVVAAMAESGCIAGNIGMESGNPDILRQIKKPGAVKTFLKAAEVFRRYPQIHIRVFLMIGFPGETFRRIRDTFRVAQEMDMDWYAITTLQPLPNTPIYDSMIEQGLVDEVGSKNVRFNSGGYGKQDEVERAQRFSSNNFEEALEGFNLDEIPSTDQLTDIWFLLNFHLNFKRLIHENRQQKIKQQIMNLDALSDVISPEHPFALYYSGVLQYKLHGEVSPSIINRLESMLSSSDYWTERFRYFNLKTDDLVDLNFEEKETRLVSFLSPESELLAYAK